ncbi:hypothetical protein FACS189425_04090 [Clostridia bacterium]|nr:hypothetical protein FACS189425_04090 [Clostridia bacterium]
MIGTLRKIFKSFKYSANGIAFCLAKERNFRIHIIAAILVIGASLFFDFSSTQSAVLIITIFLVLIMEMFNTAIENLVNLVTEEYNELAKNVKDLSAGAVALSALCAIIVGYFLFFGGKL